MTHWSLSTICQRFSLPILEEAIQQHMNLAFDRMDQGVCSRYASGNIEEIFFTLTYLLREQMDDQMLSNNEINGVKEYLATEKRFRSWFPQCDQLQMDKLLNIYGPDVWSRVTDKGSKMKGYMQIDHLMLEVVDKIVREKRFAFIPRAMFHEPIWQPVGKQAAVACKVQAKTNFEARLRVYVADTIRSLSLTDQQRMMLKKCEKGCHAILVNFLLDTQIEAKSENAKILKAARTLEDKFFEAVWSTNKRRNTPEHQGLTGELLNLAERLLQTCWQFLNVDASPDASVREVLAGKGNTITVYALMPWLHLMKKRSGKPHGLRMVSS